MGDERSTILQGTLDLMVLKTPARIEFGGVTQLGEAHRAERGVPWLGIIAC